MRESRLSGSVEGVVSDHDSYSDLRLSRPEIKGKRPAGGSLILPIYCLFLLSTEKLLVYPRLSGYLRVGNKKADT